MGTSQRLLRLVMPQPGRLSVGFAASLAAVRFGRRTVPSPAVPGQLGAAFETLGAERAGESAGVGLPVEEQGAAVPEGLAALLAAVRPVIVIVAVVAVVAVLGGVSPVLAVAAVMFFPMPGQRRRPGELLAAIPAPVPAVGSPPVFGQVGADGEATAAFRAAVGSLTGVGPPVGGQR